ncbi:N-lysine methyltransferase SETD [Parasponia andersonii]|uniref:N-lysine methyltransferase n=1 Tax=Parasponia andersonii TaxID=3476 RepID=A0A2P5D3R0_PARAD|nr:N-lysine methyltransferase SETD [Parasponia andersonii]
MVATTQTRRVRAFKRWMKSQGIECSDALQLCDCPLQGLSVRALRYLSEGDVVATIPKLACLTIRTTGARDLIDRASFDGCLGVSVAIMYERSLGQSSPWAPYLQLLPYQECLPLVWTPEEVDSLLCGTELHKTVKEDQALMCEDWKENILPLLELDSFQLDASFFSVRDYFAARTLIASRSFEIDDYHGSGMVPLADIFNHKTGAEDVHFTAVSSHSDSDGEDDNGQMNGHTNADDDEYELEPTPPVSPMDNAELGIILSGRKTPVECPSDWGNDPVALEMIMIKDVKVGSEVYNTYGSVGNAALLHRYGFTEPDNPYDIVNIDLELVLQWSLSLFSSRCSRTRVSLWRKLDYSGCVSQNSEYFEVSFDGEPQIELLSLLYIMLLPEDAYYELDFAVSTARNSEDLKGGICMFLFGGTSEMSRDMLMNKSVGNALLSLADIREGLYGLKSLEDDIEALKRCCCIRDKKLYHSLTLRICERRILEKLRTYVADAAPLRIRRASARKKLKRT